MKTKTKKIRVILDLDCETGEWDMEYKNTGNPGCSMDYMLIRNMLKAIFTEHDNQLVPKKYINFNRN